MTVNLKPAKLTLRSFGIQSRLSRRTGISAPTMCLIFSGKRRATPEQAKKLEEAFLHYGIDLTRMDLLYEVKTGESLPNYYARKFEKD